ncbi:hypothetical protein BGW38_007082, partial [Lunasporangiospora selenospora]
MLSIPEQDVADFGLCTDDVINARVRSSNEVLDSLISKSDPSKTLLVYMTYLKLWKEYCMINCEGDCSVGVMRALRFFEEVIFKRKVRKYIDPNAGFSGIVGVSQSSHKGSEKQLPQKRRLPGRWQCLDNQDIDPLECSDDTQPGNLGMEGADCEYEEEITVEEGDAGHKGSDSEDSDPEDEVQTQMSEEEVSQITESLKGTIGLNVEKTR